MLKTDVASMPNVSSAETEIYLSNVSERDEPWDAHRANADLVSELYADSEFGKHSKRMRMCANWLEFASTTGEDGRLRLKLRLANFCRIRTCPVCQWRRSLMWIARFIQAIPKIESEFPNMRFIFLTLTQKNCKITELRETLQSMNSAWQRLSQRKSFPMVGWVKAVEVTAVYDCYDGSDFVGRHGFTWVMKWQFQHKRRLTLKITDEVHPHIHVLGMVPPSYFKKNYLSQATWTDLWQKSLRVEYTPVVHVQTVKPHLGSEENRTAQITAGLLETLKYTVKEFDLTADREWLLELTRQLKNTRSIAVGGKLKDIIRDDEPEDLIHPDGSEELGETFSEIYFRWLRQSKRYVLRYTDE